MAITVILGALLVLNLGCGIRVLRRTETEEVDVPGQSGWALSRVLDELVTRRAANRLWIPLGQVPEACLAGRVPTAEHAWDNAPVVVVLEAHRALWPFHFTRLHYCGGGRNLTNTTPFAKSIKIFFWQTTPSVSHYFLGRMYPPTSRLISKQPLNIEEKGIWD